jgi:hypothetical protein
MPTTDIEFFEFFRPQPNPRIPAHTPAIPLWPELPSVPLSLSSRSSLPRTLLYCQVKYLLPQISEESATRFCDPAHPVLILGFGKCCSNQFFGDFLCNEPIETSRMLVLAYFERLDNGCRLEFLQRPAICLLLSGLPKEIF